MKTSIRSPGRRATAKAARGRPARDVIFAMHGDVPKALEEDRRFFLLFQQWKKNGGKAADPLVALMRLRWGQVMSPHFKKDDDAPRPDADSAGDGGLAEPLIGLRASGA